MASIQHARLAKVISKHVIAPEVRFDAAPPSIPGVPFGGHQVVSLLYWAYGLLRNPTASLCDKPYSWRRVRNNRLQASMGQLREH